MVSSKDDSNMANQPAEAYHCKTYLIKCFIHPLIAALFTTWEQVKKLERGYTIEEALYIQSGETFPRERIDLYEDEFF